MRVLKQPLKEKGALNVHVVSMAALQGKTAIVCVVDEDGAIHALGL